MALTDAQRKEIVNYLEANASDEELLSAAKEVKSRIEYVDSSFAKLGLGKKLGIKVNPTTPVAKIPDKPEVSSFEPTDNGAAGRANTVIVNDITRVLKQKPLDVIAINKAINGKLSQTKAQVLLMANRGLVKFNGDNSTYELVKGSK